MTRDKLIEENLPLVYACAKRFLHKGIEYDDLCSAGYIGLVTAVDRFDASLGYRFSTYAVPVILGEMKRLFREGGAVRVSRSIKELSQRARRLSDDLRRDTGREPGISALSELLGESVEKTALALSVSSPPVSLSVGDSESGNLEIPVPSSEEKLVEALSLRQALSSLSADEQELIFLRYFQRKTQSQTADRLSATQVQISRKEKKILLKLRSLLL